MSLVSLHDLVLSPIDRRWIHRVDVVVLCVVANARLLLHQHHAPTRGSAMVERPMPVEAVHPHPEAALVRPNLRTE